jgi:hypothetical protein
MQRRLQGTLVDDSLSTEPEPYLQVFAAVCS